MSARKHPDKMPVASLWWLPVFLSRYELFISSNVVKRSVIAAQFLRCRRRSSLVTAVRFSNGQEAFPLTTAAQNVCALRQKLPLRRNHFFEWSKTAVLLFDCGTSTLKSPLLRAFFTPHVHSRLRKRLSRYTLDCGFKTSESPALRGFVAERGPITGTSLYLVLKSNGLPRPKIRLKKFGFSLKIVPANIVRKLPSQRCFKPLFIASFNFSHKRRNVRFKGLRRVHTRLCSKNRTQRHTRRNRGLSLPRPQRGLVLPAISLLFHHAFIYIHFPVLCEPPSSSRGGNSSKTAVTNAVPDRFSSRFSTSRTNGPHSLSRLKAGTHSAFGERSHTAAHTAKQGRFGRGAAITTLGLFHTLRKPCVARCQNGILCRFWVLVRCASEGHREPSGQRCAYARRCSEGVAAPLGCVIFLQFGDVAVFSLCAQYFLNVRGRGVLLPSACFACSRNAGRPLVKAANLPFSEVGWASLIPAAQKQKQHLTPNSPGSLRKVPGLCFFVTSWSVPGTWRSALSCRWLLGRTCHRRCRW